MRIRAFIRAGAQVRFCQSSKAGEHRKIHNETNHIPPRHTPHKMYTFDWPLAFFQLTDIINAVEESSSESDCDADIMGCELEWCEAIDETFNMAEE
jgi:hypothetical protein